MKRNRLEVDQASLGRNWSGLMTVTRTPVPTPPQVGDHGLQVLRTCELCAVAITSKPAACTECDAGPFHDTCLQHHACPAMGGPIIGGTDKAGTGNDDRGTKIKYANFFGEEFLAQWEEQHGEEEEPDETPWVVPEETPMKIRKMHTPQEAQLEHWKLRANSLALAEEMEDENDEDAVRLAEMQGDLDGKSSFEKFRDTQPTVHPYARGQASRIDEVAQDSERFAMALEQFDKDKYASSNRASQESRRKWWQHRAMLLRMEPFPLTMEAIRVMGTMLKIGRYRSAALYFSATKQEHISLGHEWIDQLELGVKDAIRSCIRGIGADKRCPAFDLAKVCDLPDVEPCLKGPRYPKETVILFSYFACREIEASVRMRSDVQFSEGSGCGVISLWLPASKTDPKGNGVLRRHGCTCSTHPQRCPVKAAKRIYYL